MEYNMERLYYYKLYTDDVVTNENQDYKLPDNYEWIKNSRTERMKSGAVYALAIVCGFLYCKFGLHVCVVGRKKLKENKSRGFFLYGNHTQMVADVFLPAIACLGKRIYTVVSPANFGLPVIGKILPSLGALPIPDRLSMMKTFRRAIGTRIEQKHVVVIFPEAHVWPYYTKIRPFPDTSFYYPVQQNAPVYALTTTYQKRLIGKKPKITLYIDGPFCPDGTLAAKEQRAKLCELVSAAMRQRSKNSSYEYISYIQQEESIDSTRTK